MCLRICTQAVGQIFRSWILLELLSRKSRRNQVYEWRFSFGDPFGSVSRRMRHKLRQMKSFPSARFAPESSGFIGDQRLISTIRGHQKVSRCAPEGSQSQSRRALLTRHAARQVYNRMMQLGDHARGSLGYGQHRRGSSSWLDKRRWCFKNMRAL